MNEETPGWFHCGRCGHLFPARLEDPERVCTGCGKDPSTFGESQPKEAPKLPVVGAFRSAAIKEEAPPSQTRTVRKRRENHTVLKILGGWLIVVVLIVIVGTRVWSEENKLGRQVRTPELKLDGLENESAAILDEAMPHCSSSLAGFLSSGTPEARNQYISKPISLAGKIARFYGMNPLPQVNAKDISNAERRLLKLPSGLAVASVWNLVDGQKLDAVFFKEDGEWRLDWQQFVRYCDVPWPLFLAGNGNETCEFRLLARLKQGDEAAFGSHLNVVLYSARIGYPGDPSSPSPEFLVRRDSAEGRLLAAAFRARKAGKSPYDGALANGDPEEMIRVRVHVRRTVNEKGREFSIERVDACHWLSIEEAGIVALSAEQLEEEDSASRDKDHLIKPTD